MIDPAADARSRNDARVRRFYRPTGSPRSPCRRRSASRARSTRRSTAAAFSARVVRNRRRCPCLIVLLSVQPSVLCFSLRLSLPPTPPTVARRRDCLRRQRRRARRRALSSRLSTRMPSSLAPPRCAAAKRSSKPGRSSSPRTVRRCLGSRISLRCVPTGWLEPRPYTPDHDR